MCDKVNISVVTVSKNAVGEIIWFTLTSQKLNCTKLKMFNSLCLKPNARDTLKHLFAFIT